MSGVSRSPTDGRDSPIRWSSRDEPLGEDRIETTATDDFAPLRWSATTGVDRCRAAGAGVVGAGLISAVGDVVSIRLSPRRLLKKWSVCGWPSVMLGLLITGECCSGACPAGSGGGQGPGVVGGAQPQGDQAAQVDRGGAVVQPVVVRGDSSVRHAAATAGQPSDRAFHHGPMLSI